ncbi:MAG: hypothetical protein AAGA48_30825 [Myxococcota bacterium]
MWMLWSLWCGIVAAQGLDEWFPPTPLDVAEVKEILTPARLGTAAQRYDAVTASAQVDRDRQIVAAARGIEVSETRIPVALQRYATILLPLLRRGRPDRVHDWFVAEHVGLPQAPERAGLFVTGSEANAADLVAELIEELGPETPFAVATQEEEGTIVGVVVALRDPVAFDPFPRVVTPGATVRIPGTVLDSKEVYALSVQGEGVEVETYPLEGKGTFDVEFGLPAKPGIYRVALTAFKKRRLPDQPFFFSMYAGKPAPDSLILPDFGSDRQLTLEAFEASIVAQVNAARARHGLGPLQEVGEANTIRTLIADLPKNERAAARFLSKALDRDPLPGQPHGIWQAAFGAGYHSAASTAWAWSTNPALRKTVLNKDFDRIIVGAQRTETGGWRSAAVFIASSADDSQREVAYKQLQRRWTGDTDPVPAPRLQARLDELATQIATGKTKFKKGSKELSKVFKDTSLLQGAATSYMLVVPPGEAVDTSGMNLAPSAKHLAVGFATGDLGDGRGFTYSVLVLIAAADAK